MMKQEFNVSAVREELGLKMHRNHAAMINYN